MPRVYTGSSAGRGQGPLDYIKLGTGMVRDVVGLVQQQQMIANERMRIENEERSNRYKRQLTVIKQSVADHGWQGAIDENPTIFKEFFDTMGFIDPDSVMKDLKDDPASVRQMLHDAHSQYMKTGLVSDAGKSATDFLSNRGRERVSQKGEQQPTQFGGKGEELSLGGGQVTEGKPTPEATPEATSEGPSFTPLEQAIDYYYGTVSDQPPEGDLGGFRGAVVENRFPVAGTPGAKEFHRTLGQATPEERKKALESWKQKKLAGGAELTTQTQATTSAPKPITVRDINFGTITEGGKWSLPAGTDRPATGSFDNVVGKVKEFTEYEGSLEEWKRDFIKVNNLKGETPESLGKEAWKRWMGGNNTDKEFVLPGPPKESDIGKAMEKAPKGKKKAIQNQYQEVEKELADVPEGRDIPSPKFQRATKKAAQLMKMTRAEMQDYMMENPEYTGEFLARYYGENWKEKLQAAPEPYLEEKKLEVELKELGLSLEQLREQRQNWNMDSIYKQLQAAALVIRTRAATEGPGFNKITAQAIGKVEEVRQRLINDGKNPNKKRTLANAMANDPDFKAAYRYLATRFLAQQGQTPNWETIGTVGFLPQLFGSVQNIPTTEEGEAIPPGSFAPALAGELQQMPEWKRKYYQNMDQALDQILNVK
jgi:hypothetical protein